MLEAIEAGYSEDDFSTKKVSVEKEKIAKRVPKSNKTNLNGNFNPFKDKEDKLNE